MRGRTIDVDGAVAGAGVEQAVFGGVEEVVEGDAQADAGDHAVGVALVDGVFEDCARAVGEGVGREGEGVAEGLEEEHFGFLVFLCGGFGVTGGLDGCAWFLRGWLVG